MQVSDLGQGVFRIVTAIISCHETQIQVYYKFKKMECFF